MNGPLSYRLKGPKFFLGYGRGVGRGRHPRKMAEGRDKAKRAGVSK